MSSGGVLLVSNRLPVNLTESKGHLVYERSIGGVATALDSVARHVGARWVGWTGQPRIYTEAKLREARLPKRYIPVQAGAALNKGFYDHFSNRYLWPVMHGKRPSFTPSESDWTAYQAMNMRFAHVVAAASRPGDIIWIHDYHLMLLPLYLRQLGLTNRVGFFLHVPFPKPGYWLRRPFARALTESLAAADLVGLQTRRDTVRFKDYTRRASIKIVGQVKAIPIGVNYKDYHDAGDSLAVGRLQRKLQKQLPGKEIIFSLSRMDYTKGILTQLKAVRRFFSEQPRNSNVVYKLVVAPSREHLPEYKQLSRDIEEAVRRLNASFGQNGWQPISYEHRTIGFEESVAWYNLASMLLLLPSADGMNLIAKEYIAARHNDGGMAVLSTAMGAAEQLSDALLVPPDNAAAAASALQAAYKMSKSERARRWRALRKAVDRQDVFWWADSFLAALAGQK